MVYTGVRRGSVCPPLIVCQAAKYEYPSDRVLAFEKTMYCQTHHIVASSTVKTDSQRGINFTPPIQFVVLQRVRLSGETRWLVLAVVMGVMSFYGDG